MLCSHLLQSLVDAFGLLLDVVSPVHKVSGEL